MQELITWFTLAFLASIGFATWNLPRKYCLHIKQETYNRYYWIWLFIVWILFLLIFWHENITNIKYILYWLLSGFFIALWSYIFFISIDKNGFTLANSIKNVQPIFGYLWWGIILGEFSSTNPYFLLIWTLIIWAMWLLIYHSSFEEFIEHKKTIFYPILAWLILSLWVMLRKFVWDISIICITQWIAFFLFFYILNILKHKDYSFKIDRKWIKMWTIAAIIVWPTVISMFYAYKMIDFTVAYVIVNLSTIWIILIWIFITKELNFKKYKKRLFFVLLLAIIAIIFLYLSKVYI